MAVRAVAVALVVLLAQAAVAADPPAQHSPREALRPFNDLIGPWRATGQPEGTQQEKQRGFWTEMQTWQWRFQGDDAWLEVVIDKGKYFRRGELRYLADKDLYQLTLTTPDKETLLFTGPLQEGRLTLERSDDRKKETQRLVFTFLHANRFLYRYEVKPAERSQFTRLYQVGVTKDDEAFAGPGDNRPECIVSGGLGTIAVTYKDQTYYVCCGGCRDAFKENPEKYLKEFAERKEKEAREAKNKGR